MSVCYLSKPGYVAKAVMIAPGRVRLVVVDLDDLTITKKTTTIRRLVNRGYHIAEEDVEIVKAFAGLTRGKSAIYSN